ncbi:MAG: glycosyltransferase family 2 protein, partial [Candidatus Curtissbacteria bacterium]|nr:glycosyltransferase family 2 protein [Candidatus Curtissbacteria bacterium]
IVSYNTKELLEKCLRSAKAATKSLKVEIFVVDNDSRDDSAQMVKEKFPEVNLIANAKNVGFSKANNQAIKKAKGSYVVILNPDTEVMPDTFKKMKEFMDEQNNTAMGTCRVEYPNGRLDPECRRRFPTPWRSFCHFSGLANVFKGSGIFDQYHMGDVSPAGAHEIDACMGAFMIVRKSAIDEIGMFDEDFFFYGEDLDWCFRFKEAGYKIIYTPITKIVHHKGASSGIRRESEEISKATKESKKRAFKESTRAMYLFYKKHYKNKYPFFVTWIMFVGIWLLEKHRMTKA